MSVPEYKDGRYVASWDYECPLCHAMWNNEGDPLRAGIEIEEECPKCHAALLISAEWNVDYTVNVKPVPAPQDGREAKE